MSERIQNVYAIYDEKAESYVCPLYDYTDGLAARQIKQILSNPNSVIARSPEDFKLYQLATFNDIDGRYIPLDVPKFVLDIQTLKETTQA